MSRFELVRDAYNSVRCDMEHTFSFSEAESMEMTLAGSDEDLLQYLAWNEEEPPDIEYIDYRNWWIHREVVNGVEKYRIEFEGNDMYFDTIAEAVNHINKYMEQFEDWR